MINVVDIILNKKIKYFEKFKIDNYDNYCILIKTFSFNMYFYKFQYLDI